MRRLTKITDVGLPVIVGDKSLYPVECYDCCIDNKVAKKLLEDAIAKLAEYENLEEQGKLLKLPCAVGDTVYHICTLKNGKSEIIEMKVGCVEPCGAIRNHKGVCEVWNVYAETDYTKEYFKFFDFGKTVFLTREEAEAALKKNLKIKKIKMQT